MAFRLICHTPLTPFTLRKVFGTRVRKRLSPSQGHRAAGRIRWVENCSDLIGNRIIEKGADENEDGKRVNRKRKLWMRLAVINVLLTSTHSPWMRSGSTRASVMGERYGDVGGHDIRALHYTLSIALVLWHVNNCWNWEPRMTYIMK
jgi:hypothetical protein